MLRFRAPGRALRAEELLGRALPGLTAAGARTLLARGALREARPGPRGPRPGAALGPGAPVAPGTALQLDLRARDPRPAPQPDARAPSERDGSPGGGPAAPRTCLGLAPEPPWPEARRAVPGGEVHLRCGEARGGVVRLHLELAGEATLAQALDLAADLGAPLLGDVRRGGVLVAGGLRLALPDGEAGARGRGSEPSREEREGGEAPTWPDEPVFAPDATEAGEAARFAVSAATARALRAGHPWVRPDAATGDPARFRPGALVHLAPPRGPTLGLARVEGPGPVAARVWATDVRRPRDAPSIEARVHRALGRRRALLAAAEEEGGTDAFRLVHGEADGLPGLAVDRLGALLRVLVTGRAAWPLRRRVVDAVLGGLGRALPVVEVRHLVPAPRQATLRAVIAERGAPAPGPHPVCESGLVFRVDPGLARPDHPRPGVGLFLDQRANRARVRTWARAGGRYLNLFAHTGAFSVALLAGGADEVVSVDLSAPYLAWLEDHLAANAGRLDPARHRAVRGDARRFVEGLAPAERFDGIVLDPPTAAAAGHRFWSVEQGLARLGAAALARLAPGGWLLLCRNERRARTPLRTLAAQAARDAGVRLAAVEDAPPGEDFPRLAGFPEGDPFEGVRLVRADS